MNRSGLLQQRFAILLLGCRDRLSSSSPLDRGRLLSSCVRWGGAMTLIVLATICFPACAFYVYVLFHWMRDTKPRTTTGPAAENRPDEKYGKKGPYIIGARSATSGEGRSASRSTWAVSRRSGRAVARLIAMSANGVQMNRSRDLGAWAGESSWVSL
jgi:hypothetical protein